MTRLIDLPSGTLLKHYRIEKVLGRGGFGVTYQATDCYLNTVVAIKEYIPEEIATRGEKYFVFPKNDDLRDIFLKWRDGFLREARTLASIKHPNIVQVLSFLEANNTAYMVMEYEDGNSLSHYSSTQREGVTEEWVKTILKAIFSGLEYLHQQGIIHRDIKPANILIRTDGTPVLLDFGSARQHNPGVSNTFSATPGFTPFEQWDEEPNEGPWTDIYALGATLYALLAGKKPVDALSRHQAIQNRLADPLTSLTEVCGKRCSPPFIAAIEAGLAVSAQQRPQSIDQWRGMFFPEPTAEAGGQPAEPAPDIEESPPVKNRPAPSAGAAQPAEMTTVMQDFITDRTRHQAPAIAQQHQEVMSFFNKLTALHQVDLSAIGLEQARMIIERIKSESHLPDHQILFVLKEFFAFLNQINQAGRNPFEEFENRRYPRLPFKCNATLITPDNRVIRGTTNDVSFDEIEFQANGPVKRITLSETCFLKIMLYTDNNGEEAYIPIPCRLVHIERNKLRLALIHYDRVQMAIPHHISSNLWVKRSETGFEPGWTPLPFGSDLPETILRKYVAYAKKGLPVVLKSNSKEEAFKVLTVHQLQEIHNIVSDRNGISIVFDYPGSKPKKMKIPFSSRILFGRTRNTFINTHTVTVDHDSVADRHFILTQSGKYPDVWFIRRWSPTLLNGRKMERVETLSKNAVIQAGDVRIHVFGLGIASGNNG